MSHHIYQTEGFIIQSADIGDSNKLLTIFTKDLGLIRATAQGVRHLKSKLRYSLQELSFSSIALVRGREVWRITSARKLISLFDKRLPIQARKSLAKVLVFVERLMPEEGKNEEIFNILSNFSAIVFNEREMFINEPETIDAAELLAKLRVLHVLGYGTNNPHLIPFIENTNFDKEKIKSFSEFKAEAGSEIDKSLEESQL